jgi:EAL domain-containing protein (putative c-di-GMP-specific phosphodiesterase class I)
VLEQALCQIARWREVSPDVTMSVNLSFRQLEDAGLTSMLARVIHATDVDPAALCLEIGETAIMRNPDVVVRALQGLKTIGVRIAIDDYGTGSSSLSRLRQLPLDTLKIHQSFVAGLGDDPEETSIVAALVELGHALGLSVVAEGVETDAQLAALRVLGCDGAQGYLLGRPAPEEDLRALLGPQ